MLPLPLRKNGVINASDAELERAQKFCEHFAIASTFLVFVGLVLQVYIAIKHPSFDSCLERFGSTAADILVAFGVLGELLPSLLVRRYNTEVKRRSDDRLSEATKQAGEANRKAAEAHERTAQLDNETARLRLAGRANAFAIGMTLVTGEVQAFSQGMVPKDRLSEAARSLLIISKVKPFAGKLFDAVVMSSDIWLDMFLGSLTGALKNAGWIEVEQTKGSAVQHDGEPSIGGAALVKIHVDESKISELWEAAQALASALQAEGIEALAERTSIPENSNANVIHILIHPKVQ